MARTSQTCWLWAVIAWVAIAIASAADVWIDVNENQNYIGRHECSFVQAGNKFYFLGGREDAKRVDRYDYASNTWSNGAPAPKEFNHFQAVAYQGLIWVVGAFNTNNYPDEVSEPNVYVYDPAVNVWMVGPTIPAGRRRGGAGLAVFKDQFYVVGGNTLGHTGGPTGSVKFLDRYDPRTNAWQVLADAPNARDHFHAVAVDGTRSLYNIGGRATDLPDAFDKTVATVDVYDFPLGVWSTLTNVSLPSPRAGASNVLFEGRILVIGGESSSQAAAFKNVDAFNLTSQRFSSLAPLKYGRHGTQALVSGRGVIITGGSPTRGGGYQTNMEAYSQFAPVGSRSTVGVLRGPSGRIVATKDTTTNVNLVHSSGNTGLYIQNISFQGADAPFFSVASMPSVPFLLGQSETRTVLVRYSGNRAIATANLVVSYSGTSTLSLSLQGVNPNPRPTAPPSKQPTLRPTSTPSFRRGVSSFSADGNALRAAVVTYLAEVQKLPTLRRKLDHNLSIAYGYPIGYWDVSKVTSFRDVFRARNSTDPRSSFNEQLTLWNTSSGTSMAGMFFQANAFEQDLSSFDTSQVTDMNHMFKNAYNFTGKGLRNWKTSRVTNMWNMFHLATSFNGDVTKWDTGRVITMKTMFRDAASFNQDISKWNVTMLVDATEMFTLASKFNKSLCAWGPRLKNSTILTRMFVGTSCPLATTEVWFSYSPPGPFCHYCCCRPTLRSRIEGPIEVPLVPAAAGNMHSNLILAWSAMARYRYGGAGGATYTTLFDPSTQASTLRRVAETGHDMFCSGTATLPDGRILVTGGQTNALTSIFDPRNDTWSRGQRMHIGRGYQSQLTLSDGRVFVFGGSWNGGIGGKNGEVYTEFGNGSAAWTWKSGISTIPSCLTNDAEGLYRSDSHMWLFEHTDGRILQAGPSKRMHWITLAGDGAIAPTVFRGDDNDAMVGGAVYFDLNKIFTVGGSPNYDSGLASNRAYIIDISGTQPVVTRQPNMIWARAFVNAVVLPNGWIVCAGGQSKVTLFSDSDAVQPIEIFDPVAKRFYELLTPLKVPRTYHSVALLMKDGRVLIGGGGLCGSTCDYSTTYNHPNVEILTPPYLISAAGGLAPRPTIRSVSNPSTISPGGSIQVTMDTSGPHTFSLIRTGVTTHSTNLDQRRVPLTVTSQAGAVFTVRAPSSRAHVPPGVYWLFAMNGAGVPSVGYSLTRTYP